MDLSEEEEKLQNIPEKHSVSVTKHGNVAVIHMCYGQNRLNHAFVTELNKKLDQVEHDDDVHVVITTSEGKFYCNGLDIEFMMAVDSKREPQRSFTHLLLYPLYMRLLTFPKPTIAAINGHCFAGGMLLALCHDYRIMNTHNGWISMNEVHINMIFTPFLLQLLEKRLPNGSVFNEVLAIGKRYTAAEALKAGLVNETSSSRELVPKSIDLAKSLVARGPYNKQSMFHMKRQLYAQLEPAKAKL